MQEEQLVRRREGENFLIHEDAPRTEDTEMMVESEHRTEEDQEGEDQDQAEDETPESESSDDNEPVDSATWKDMDRLYDCLPNGFQQQYRLIKRIGEGMRESLGMGEQLR